MPPNKSQRLEIRVEMTELLVSVRNAEEAHAALEGGADVVDVKEPRRGALGAADPTVWRKVQSVVGDRAKTSVALGELLAESVEMLAGEATGFVFAKVGLAGCAAESSWRLRWDRVMQILPSGVLPVPVAYADEQAAQSPEVREVLELAVMSPAKLMLIDTFNKGRGHLVDHLTFEALAKLCDEAERCSVQLALAGSLKLNDIERLLALAPAYLGVRGAACVGGRDGTVDETRVKSLVKRIRGFAGNEASRGLTTAIARPILPCR